MSGTVSDRSLNMVVTAGHELKSPLALIRQLALDIEASDSPDESTRALANQIILTSERALRLTGALTKHSRLEDSLFELEPINPRAICEEVIDEIAPLCHAQSRRIVLKNSSKKSLVVANRDLLRRVLLNFVDNALGYGADDTVVDLSIRSIEKGRFFRLGVRDYGPTISAEMWRQLGQEIGHSYNIISRRPDSSGLGVYIASRFAEAMNAKVGAIRHRDGATFYVDVHASTQLRMI